jgi:hypothetical protein
MFGLGLEVTEAYDGIYWEGSLERTWKLHFWTKRYCCGSVKTYICDDLKWISRTGNIWSWSRIILGVVDAFSWTEAILGTTIRLMSFAIFDAANDSNYIITIQLQIKTLRWTVCGCIWFLYYYFRIY